MGGGEQYKVKRNEVLGWQESTLKYAFWNFMMSLTILLQFHIQFHNMRL